MNDSDYLNSITKEVNEQHQKEFDLLFNELQKKEVEKRRETHLAAMKEYSEFFSNGIGLKSTIEEEGFINNNTSDLVNKRLKKLNTY